MFRKIIIIILITVFVFLIICPNIEGISNFGDAYNKPISKDILLIAQEEYSKMLHKQRQQVKKYEKYMLKKKYDEQVAAANLKLQQQQWQQPQQQQKQQQQKQSKSSNYNYSWGKRK
jgi:hypothetical protein